MIVAPVAHFPTLQSLKFINLLKAKIRMSFMILQARSETLMPSYSPMPRFRICGFRAKIALY